MPYDLFSPSIRPIPVQSVDFRVLISLCWKPVTFHTKLDLIRSWSKYVDDHMKYITYSSSGSNIPKITVPLFFPPPQQMVLVMIIHHLCECASRGKTFDERLSNVCKKKRNIGFHLLTIVWYMYREKTHTHALAYTSVALQILDRICLFFSFWSARSKGRWR